MAMHELTHYGYALRPHAGGGSSVAAKTKTLAMAGVEIGGTAGLLSFLAAYSRAHNISLGNFVKNGEILGVPYTLIGAILATALGLTNGLGQRASPHLLNAAIGGFTAWMTALGVKLGYRGTTVPVSVGYTPGSPYPYGNYYGSYVGATPETERLFREAGI